MNITDQIINEINVNNDFVFALKEFRIKFIKKKKLSIEEFKEFIKFIEKNFEFIVKLNNLSNFELVLFSNGFRKSKFIDINHVFNITILANNKATPFFLYNLLLKRCKLGNTRLLENYLSDIIKNKVYLIHLKIFNVISKYYPNLINQEIIEFAKKQNHPICKQITSMDMTIIE